VNPDRNSQIYINYDSGYHFNVPQYWKVENLPNKGDKIIYPNTHAMYTDPLTSQQEDYIKNLKDFTYGPRISINVSKVELDPLSPSNTTSLDQCNKVSKFVTSIGYVVSSLEEKKLPKEESKACIINYERQGKEYNNPTSVVIIQRGPFVYTISLNAGNSEYFKSGSDVFEKILNSFKFNTG